jgi:hypothetical protein
MVLQLKFRLKFNGTPCQHQSHCATCPVKIFFNLKKIKNDILKKKKKKKKKRIKNFGGGRMAIWRGVATPFGHGGGQATPRRF